MPERVDDFVQSPDDLLLAPPCGKGGGSQGQDRHGQTLNGNKRDQNLIADGA